MSNWRKFWRGVSFDTFQIANLLLGWVVAVLQIFRSIHPSPIHSLVAAIISQQQQWHLWAMGVDVEAIENGGGSRSKCPKISTQNAHTIHSLIQPCTAMKKQGESERHYVFNSPKYL